MGFDGFEIDGKVLVEQIDQIKKASELTQFPVVMVCGGYQGWIGDFDEHKRLHGIEDIKKILTIGSMIGIKGIVVPAAWGMFSKRLPPMVPPRSEQEDEFVLIDSLKRLEAVAQETHTTIYLEPLNRYEDYMLNRTEDAARIIQKGSFQHVKICYDFFHMNIEEPRMEIPIVTYAPLIGHIHLASSHRYQPGSGHLDFQTGLKALAHISYQGYASFECRVIGDDVHNAYQTSVEFMRVQFKEAGL
jgi:sugar phosphate isomerase/epimerase